MHFLYSILKKQQHALIEIQ